MSEDASSKLLVHRVAPNFPQEAKRARIHGPVVLTVIVRKDGTVLVVHLLSGPKELAQAAVDAVRQWRYKPFVINGEPIEMETRATLNFKLQ
ncbi:MAG: hypothetical protein DMG93_05555 [Acidobacteria bacterium]|nr:MAG: hypothetical protein DMG93_05555 [Acidobacteriota bacterium]